MKRKDLYDDTLAMNAESRGERNDLNAARGIANGIALSVIFYALAYGAWRLLR